MCIIKSNIMPVATSHWKINGKVVLAILMRKAS